MKKNKKQVNFKKEVKINQISVLKPLDIFRILTVCISIIALLISVFTYLQTREVHRMDSLIEGINLLNNRETFASGIQYLWYTNLISTDEKARIVLNALLFTSDYEINPYETYESANILKKWGSNNYYSLFDFNRVCFQNYSETKFEGAPEYFYCVRNSGKIIMKLITLDKTTFIEDQLLTGIYLNPPQSMFPIIISDREFSFVDFSGIGIDNVDFPYYLDIRNTLWKDSILTRIRFINTQMQRAKFDDSRINNVEFNATIGTGSSFRNVIFVNCSFIAADFQESDFSYADFTETFLFEDGYCEQGTKVYNNRMISKYSGSNFLNAKGLTDRQKECLCLSGAINVPGGCGEN